MAAVHKKHEKIKEPPNTKSDLVSGEPKPVVVSDVVTETTERVEVIEEVTPDPLTDFKEKMSEEEEQPVSSVPPQKNFMWPILFIVFLALASLIGIFVYKQSANKDGKVNVVTLTPTPTVMPQPTKAVNLTQYEIKILNGSEVSGEAGRQKESLEKEGFTVSSIGNAATSNYKETIIQAKKEVDKDFLDKLKSVLELSFIVGDSEELSSDADSDVIVIIGSQTN